MRAQLANGSRQFQSDSEPGSREHRTLLVQDVAIHVPIENGWERFFIIPTTARFEREGIPKGFGNPVPPGDRLQILVAPPKDSHWRIYCQFVREESRFRSLQILAKMIWQDGTWKSGGLRKLWSGRVIGEPGQIASDAAPRD